MPIVSETHSCIPSLLFAAGVPVGVFLAALHIPHQVELQKCDTKYKISFRWNCCFESCVVNRERKKKQTPQENYIASRSHEEQSPLYNSNTVDIK